MAARLEELAFCRQRLRHLHQHLESPETEELDLAETAANGIETTSVHSPAPSTAMYWESIRGSTTARVLLPDGDTDLDESANGFVRRLKPEQWDQLDQSIHDDLLAELGGLHRVCITGSDLPKYLAGPMIGAAAKCLGTILPETDVAHVEFSIAAGSGDIRPQLRGVLRSRNAAGR
jgi:hypothetical protein